MNQIVESGKTLLVDGPASVSIISGKADVFGATLSKERKVVVREGKRLPFTVKKTAHFDISLGESAGMEQLDGDTIPASWYEALKRLPGAQPEPYIIIVIGNVNSGKTSFCTFLINNLVMKKHKVAILDGDLGQSDVGPPCTISYTLVTRPITDIFNLRAKSAFFVGVTSPAEAMNKMVDGLALLGHQITNGDPDFIVVNTDGWTEGEKAISYKSKLVETFKPDIVFFVQQEDELMPLLGALKDFQKMIVDSSKAAGQRDREKRRNLRELGYVKYLKDAKVKSIPMSWLEIEEDELIGLGRIQGKARQFREIYELLGMKPLHLAELADEISIVIGKRRWIDPENIRKVEKMTGKRVMVFRKGEEEGRLVGLYDVEKRFLGIGLLREIDYRRKVMKIFTPVSEKIFIVVFGKTKLDRNLKETSTFMQEDGLDFSMSKYYL
ncbi:hypothetical protein GTO27_09655 [Candidatus Bathyarchaeota archaeon]|nr:hypothetical protein [Candidatus Bathyarchaeota archaeon]